MFTTQVHWAFFGVVCMFLSLSFVVHSWTAPPSTKYQVPGTTVARLGFEKVVQFRLKELMGFPRNLIPKQFTQQDHGP